MKQEEFNKLFGGIDDKNFQEKILDIQTILSKENDILETSYSTIKQKDDEINQLRDTNQRLFLRVSDNTNDGTLTTEDDKSDITINSIIDSINKGE